MQAEEIILQVRSRLRDTDYSALAFSDSELLDTISQVQTRLTYSFDANIQTHSAQISQESPRLQSAQAILKVISASLDSKPLSLSTHAQSLRHPR